MIDNLDDYKKWLAELEVGDKVAISHRTGYSIGTIERITPTRRFKTKHFEFNNDGWQRGDSWSRSKLTPVTIEILDGIEKDKLLYKFNNYRFNDLSINTLRKIDDLLQADKGNS